MAVAKYKTWITNEVLTSADLNASFDQVFDNQADLGWPREATSDFNGQTLILDADGDSSLRETSDDVIALRLQGQDLFIFDGDAASAVNGLRFTAGTAGSPTSVITAQGSSTNIDLSFVAKGGGNINFTTDVVDLNGAIINFDLSGGMQLREIAAHNLSVKLQGVDVFVFDGDVASPVNGLTFRSSATGVAPVIAASGSDANIGITLTPKGSGEIVLGASTVTATPTATAVPVAGGGGTLADGWIAASNVTQHAALVRLASYAPSGAGSVDITSVISATYNRYEIYFNLRTSVDADSLFFRTDENNGASFDTTGYGFGAHTVTTGGTGTSAGSAGAGAIAINGNTATIGNATNEGISGRITISFVGSASMFPIIEWSCGVLNGSTLFHHVAGSGTRAVAAAINAVQLIMSSGSITGSVEVYGLRAA